MVGVALSLPMTPANASKSAPSAPKNAVSIAEPFCAIFPKNTIAGAVVKAEVKNIPPKKLSSQ